MTIFSAGSRRAWSAEEGEDEEDAEGKVDGGEEEVVGVGAMLRDENDDRNGVSEFFEDGGNHDGAKADGIGCDQQKRDLPDEGETGEAVIESGMRDRRRILRADALEKEVERRDEEQSPDAGDREDDFCEFHAASRSGWNCTEKA